MFPTDELRDLDVPTLWAAIESAADLADLAVYVARVDVQPARILYVNARASAITGRPIAELIGATPWSMLRREEWPTVQALTARPAGAPPVSLEAVVDRPDGTQRTIEVAATRIQGRAGELFVFGYFRDVTQQRATKAALVASETRFTRVLEAAPDGVVILARGVVTYINPRAVALLGASSAEEVLGQPIAAFLPPEDAALAGQRIGQLLRTGQETGAHEYRAARVPGRTVEIKAILFEWEGQRAVLAFARDVTERNALQRRLLEADRLSTIGTLAAGVAHEINNPLTYARLNVVRLKEGGGDAREALDDIDHAITRIAAITQTLRSFARPAEQSPGPVDLTAVVERALKMVDNELRHQTRLAREYQAIPSVNGIAAQLEQVVVNLLLNALKALRPDRDNLIRVRLEPSGRDRVLLAIEDTGVGIPQEIRGKIFDPFFSSRAHGEGMGLGLAVSRSIVEAAGGRIDFETLEGHGTTFRVELSARAERPASTPRPSAEVSHRRRVLLVDDEPLVRASIARLLETRHEVVAVESGAAALAALASGRFDAILCDVMMPHMNGRECHARIAEQRPGLERRVIFLSGGAMTPELDAAIARSGAAFLAKPFGAEELFATIERIAANAPDPLPPSRG